MPPVPSPAVFGTAIPPVGAPAALSRAATACGANPAAANLTSINWNAMLALPSGSPLVIAADYKTTNADDVVRTARLFS